MSNSSEVAALNELLATVNNPNIVGVEVPKGVSTKVIAPPPAAAPAPEQVWIEEPPAAPAAPVAAPAAPRGAQKLFFTGRLKSGKDHAAHASGATIFGFADPLYAIVSHSFGVTVSSTEGKDIAGVRELLQVIGQWGRGVINEKYPLTTVRALFIRQVQADGIAGAFGHPEIDWAHYGNDNDIWLNGCVIRANEHAATGARVAITNCRFDNEFKRLLAEGFVHWHVMCSPKTWSARLAQSKLTPESPAVKDLSETLAAKLDQDVIKQVSAVKQGPLLRAIWSDDLVPKPSARLHTVESFLKSI